jgi:tetratricopeptide (TPR) repeat protein
MTKKTLRPFKPREKQMADTKKNSIEQAMQMAMQKQASGQLHEAEKHLRQILQARPDHPFALHLLGVIAHQVGKTEEAVRLIEQAIRNLPQVGQFHSNLGEMCRILQRLDEAVSHGERAVALDPGSATAHSNLGVAYYDRKELEKAEACQQRALAIDPNLPSALNNMGSIRRELKDKDGAINFYRRVLAVEPRHLESMNNLGAVLTEAERPEEAIQLLIKAIQMNPHYAEAHCNIGNAFLMLEQFDRAAVGFNNTLALRADYPKAYLGLARIYQEQKRFEDAENMVQKALALAPEMAEAQSLLGGIYTEAGYPEKAELAFAKAVELKSDLLSAHLGSGHLLMEQGRIEAAEAAFRHAMSLDDTNLGARLALAQVKKVTDGDENMAALIQEADKLDSMLETKAMSLHFALGKCYNDTKQHDLAMPHFLAGCRLKRKRTEYDPDNNDKICRNICEFFSPETMEKLRGEGCPSSLPIFVLGMPRSGTTLTEQIIASHPLVHGAGELPDLLALAATPRNGSTDGYPLSLKGITRQELKEMGEKYVLGLRTRNTEARHITDKMPANFHCIGLIHLMLPNAGIIHVKRNPVDTCLSGFTNLFNKSQHHSYDLTELGRYYRNYATLMDHWRKVLPANAFYEVQYEDLVSDHEPQARALLDFCNLPWDPACLDFHRTKRNIRTASVTQVRQPIYTSSVDRWRKYEAHLGPLLEALGDLVPGRLG